MSEISYDDQIKVELIQSHGSDEMIARAARVSSKKDLQEGLDSRRLVRALWREGHTVPFEHTLITVRVQVPLFLTPQILKHRHTSISQLSGRYSKMPLEFYTFPPDRPLANDGTSMSPEMVSGSEELRRIVDEETLAVVEQGVKSYNRLIDNGASNEVARTFLPINVFTVQYISLNLHGWFKLLGLRNGSQGHPQWEIAQLSKQIEEIIQPLFPHAFEAWKELG